MSDEQETEANPWTIACAAFGILALVAGLILALIPPGDDATSIDLVRVLVGMLIAGAGGTLIACWLLLAGIGWHLQRSRYAPR